MNTSTKTQAKPNRNIFVLLVNDKTDMMVVRAMMRTETTRAIALGRKFSSIR